MCRVGQIVDLKNPLAGSLEFALRRADEFASAEKAPAIRLDHFLLATLFESYAPHADDMLKVAAKVRDEWKEDMKREY